MAAGPPAIAVPRGSPLEAPTSRTSACSLEFSSKKGVSIIKIVIGGKDNKCAGGCMCIHVYT